MRAEARASTTDARWSAADRTAEFAHENLRSDNTTDFSSNDLAASQLVHSLVSWGSADEVKSFRLDPTYNSLATALSCSFFAARRPNFNMFGCCCCRHPPYSTFAFPRGACLPARPSVRPSVYL